LLFVAVTSILPANIWLYPVVQPRYPRYMLHSSKNHIRGESRKNASYMLFARPLFYQKCSVKLKMCQIYFQSGSAQTLLRELMMLPQVP